MKLYILNPYYIEKQLEAERSQKENEKEGNTDATLDRNDNRQESQ